MAGTLLHLGVEHPDLLPIALASGLTLALGLAVGLFADRIRGWLGRGEAEDAAWR